MAGTHVAVHTERQVLSPAAFMDFRYEVNRLLRGGETTRRWGYGAPWWRFAMQGQLRGFALGPLHDGWMPQVVEAASSKAVFRTRPKPSFQRVGPLLGTTSRPRRWCAK